MHPLAIIGIDPGTTSAYSIIDLKGNILKQHSGKELTLSMMIEQIVDVCLPLIISTDKAKVPSFVDELSRKLGTIIISPPEDLKREDKRELILKWEYPEHSEDSHQADSLAAALYAYRKYLPRLEKIESFIREKKLDHKRDEFTKMALTTDLHFSQIQEMLTKPLPEHKIMEEVISQKKITQKEFLSLYQRLVQLKERNKALERRIEEQEKQLTALRNVKQNLEKRSSSIGQKIDNLFRFKENRLKGISEQLQKQEKNNAVLKKKVKSLVEFMGKIPEHQLLKKLSTLGQREYQEKKGILGLTEKAVLYVENPDIYSEQVVQELKEKESIVLSPKKAGKGIRIKVKTGILTRNEMIDENEYFALIEPELIDKIVSSEEIIEKVIMEYQEKRRREKT